MRFTSFSDTATDKKYTYSYTKRGIKELYCPDKMRERIDNMDVYDKTSGNLFYDIEVSWSGEDLLDKSVDINVDLGEKHFVDHIYIEQSEDSRPGTIDILCHEKNNLKKVASHSSGTHITEKEITIPVGYYCDNIVIRLNGAYEDIGIRKLDICSALDIENTLFPIPESITYSNGMLSFDKITGISSDCSDSEFAASYLGERLREKFGLSVASAVADGEIKMQMTTRNDEGFEIVVNETECRILAGCKRGFIYAADALVQLGAVDGIKCCTIYDKPMMEFRGIHVGMPAREDLPFFKKFIREVAVPMRYNAIIIEINAALRYDNFPEINEAWLNAIDKYDKGEWPRPAHYGYVGGDIYEKDEVAELCDYIRSFGMEIVPEVQCLSHAQYITTAYPQLAEIEANKDKGSFGNLYMADNGPDEFYDHNMCPLHKDYYKYVFGIIDEVVDAMRPERYLHMGHDEGYMMGTCEICSKHDKARLFADEVNKLNEYIKSKNLSMMIWSDMLQSEYRYDKIYSTPEAINYVDKDVIMMDFTWYFHPELDLEDKLLKRDFNVVIGNLYSSHFPRYDYRSKKPGIIGGQISMWVQCNEDRYAYEGKMYDMLYTANMMWNSSYNSDYRLSYNEMVKPLLWNTKCAFAGVDADAKCRTVNFAGDIRNVPNELLWNIPYEKAIAISHDLPEIEVQVGDKAETLFITHATNNSVDRVMWKPPFKFGEYELCYDDGSSVSIAVSYAQNICKHSMDYGAPIASILFRHQGYIGTYFAKPICGKDAYGKDYTLLELPIKNPNPQKTIKSIKLKHMQNTDAKIVIYDIKLSRPQDK